MKLDVFNVDDFITINNLEEVTSPVLFQHGVVPDPKGLISNEIFGVTTTSRKKTFAYIDLHAPFFHPHVYKALRRMFRNVDKIVSGDGYYSLDSEGRIVKDEENGETGIDFLYKNWEKINWVKPKQNEEDTGMSMERVKLITNLKKKEAFMTKQIVIPAFYRDIKTSADNNGGSTDDVNNMYIRLIRLVTLIENQDMFDFSFHSTNYNVQNTIVEIYDFFKHKLEKKNGMIRKYLMGKNVDYCTRTVITSPSYHANRPEDLFIDFSHAALPVAQVCSLAYPFVVKYVKDFFERELIDNKEAKIIYDPASDSIDSTVTLVDPESYFSDKYIKKMIDTFIRDPESRFNKIEVPTTSKTKRYLYFTGKRQDASTTAELSTIMNRPMTWCDLLYQACEYVTRDKHCLITRYPVNNEFNVFCANIRVSSTTKTMPMMVNGYLYKWYPVIDPNVRPEDAPNLFIDATMFSNSYLAGIDGDYDGDQVTVKIIWTQEANEECANFIKTKGNFIDEGGSNIRKIEKEALQSLYVLTKEPYGDYKPLSKEEVKYFCSLDPKQITLEKLVEWFGNTVSNGTGEHNTKIKKSNFNVSDTLKVYPSDYKLIKDSNGVKTTLGRLIFNKVFIEGLRFDNLMEYQNKVFKAGDFKKFDSFIGNALKEDLITPEKMVEYINTRDWFGLELHGIITTSFTLNTLKVPESVKKLKKELLEKNKEAIENGDSRVVEQMENKLLDATLKEFGNDIGLDLYISGARGSVSNHLKNILLSRGAIGNPVTGGFDIVTNSLLDGLNKKDIVPHSNTIVTGSYPKSVNKYRRTKNSVNCWNSIKDNQHLFIRVVQRLSKGYLI